MAFAEFKGHGAYKFTLFHVEQSAELDSDVELALFHVEQMPETVKSEVFHVEQLSPGIKPREIRYLVRREK